VLIIRVYTLSNQRRGELESKMENKQKTYKVKFVEETCHTYEIKAEDETEAEELANLDYYDEDSEKWEGLKHLIKYIGKEPESNDSISCELLE